MATIETLLLKLSFCLDATIWRKVYDPLWTEIQYLARKFKISKFENLTFYYHEMTVNTLKVRIWNPKVIFPNLYLPYNWSKLVKKTILMQICLNSAKNRHKNIFTLIWEKLGETFNLVLSTRPPRCSLQRNFVGDC